MSDHDIENKLNSITPEKLSALVARVLGVQTVQIVDWQYEALHGGMAVFDEGLYRWYGRADAGNQLRSWMMILKIIRADVGYYSNDPAAWNYWKREALAYQSGLLDDLPGQLAAPRCFGVDHFSENEVWIWLEVIPAEASSGWYLDRFGVAARHLGQFNGAYLGGKSLPQHSWFSSGRVEEWLVHADMIIPLLDESLEHPLVKLWFPDDMANRTKNVWSRRQEMLDALAKLPRTLCHHDAHRRNLIAATDQRNQDITFAIDWAVLGTGVIGEEIATTFTVSLQFLDWDARLAPQLDKHVYEGYLAGLRDAGWNGNSNLVRYGFIASAVLFMALGAVEGWLPWLLSENGPQEIEDYLQQPIDDVLIQWSTMQAYLLDLADEALALKEGF